MNDLRTDADVLRLEIFNTSAWMTKAENLRRAASVFEGLIRNHRQLPSSDRHGDKSYLNAHFMLMGFAIENLLKAIIVLTQLAKLQREFDQKKKLPDILQTHNLLDLFDCSGLRTDSGKIKGLLMRLSRSIIWEGRYPAPLRPEDYRRKDTFDLGAKFVTINAFADADVQNLDALFNGLLDIVKKEKAKLSKI